MAAIDAFRSMGTARIAALIAVPLVMIGLFAYLALHMTSGNMVPLFSNLALEDSSKIIAELEKNNTPYELGANGTQILVPSDRVLRLRMTMAEENLPSGGSVVGYEIFDRSETFGSSNFVMNINAMRALEGELARTIGSLNGVESARVHLVVPKHELFTREKEKPSASVTIKMHGGQTLEHAEVGAISHLVAAAVPGLDAGHVTIVDNHGKLLARGDGGDGVDGAATTAQEFRIAYETRLQQTLEDLIEKVVGPGKVRVQVNADMNFDRVVTNSEKYDPDGQVVRSTQSTSEREMAKEKNANDSVTVGNNLPKGQAGNDSAGSSDRNTDHTEDTTNYEISKTTQNHIQEGGNLNRLSVAALVDGNYTQDADKKDVYAPRTPEEIAQIKTLLSSAMGFDDKRGDKLEVVNMRFTQDANAIEATSFFDKFKTELQPILQTLIIAVVAILAILLVLRPALMQLIKQMQPPSAKLAADLAALEGPGGVSMASLPGAAGGAGGMLAGGGGIGGGADGDDTLVNVANIKGSMKSSSMKNVTEIIDKYPEETMGVLRQWLMAPAAGAR